jgi:hypothetical protein
VVFRRQNNDEVIPQEAAGLQDQGAVLVDVREDDEWAAGHAPEAVHIPLAEVSDAASRTGAGDGDEFAVGDLIVRAVHTPGHTPHHLSYVVLQAGEPVAAFTGGSMLYGTVGRTDLVSTEATEELTRAQFHSVRRLAEELPGEVGVHPTHEFGSFCSSASSSGSDASTIGQERQSNLALTLDDEDAFVDKLLSGLTAYPRYYAHMAPINRAGPAPIDLSPPEPVDRPRSAAASMPASGSWTCGRAPRSLSATWPAPSTLRWGTPSPPTWGGRCGGGPR